MKSVTDISPIENLKSLARTFRSIHSRYLTAMLLLLGLAAVGAVSMLLYEHERDWPFFGAMYLVIFAYVMAYIRAHDARRILATFMALLSSVALLSFFAFILFDRIPERTIWLDDALAKRRELELLWGPVALHGVVVFMLLLHWVWVGRFRRRADAASREIAAAEAHGAAEVDT